MSQLRFDFQNLSVDKLNSLLDNYISSTKKLINTIVNNYNNKNDINYSNTFKLLTNNEHENGFIGNLLSLVSNFYEDEKLNIESTNLKKILSDFEIDVNYNNDLFQALNHAFENTDKNKLSNEELKYANDTLLNFKRLGVDLNDSEIQKISKELSNLEIEFQDNVNKYNKEFTFTKHELSGVPERWFTNDKLINNQEQKDTYKVTLSYPDYYSVIEYCDSEKVRKFMYEEFSNKCSDTNETIMTKILTLRHTFAKKLGYKNFADYATQKKLIQTGNNALEFLNNLNIIFNKQYYQEVHDLTQFAIEYQKNPLQKSTLDKWDFSYYGRLYKEHMCNIDKSKLTDYFPLDHVVSATMKIYQHLLNLTFKELNTSNKWHNDVRLFEVKDTNTSDILGHFFLDLYPRKNKYNHAAVFDIYPCYLDSSNNYTTSLCAMACNFEKDGCISFDNAKTFFHEFGHVMHFTCGRTQLAHNTGFNIEWDAVEIPSTMFELWCLEKDSLNILSCHKDTKKPLDDDTIKNLKKFINFNFAIFIKRQLMYGLFDMYVHTFDFDNNSNFSCQNIWNSLDKQLTGYFPQKDYKHFCSFGHIISGYSAGYYGYLLSESHADQIFCKLFKDNVMNQDNGLKLRKIFFEQGSTKSANTLFFELLQEKFNPRYFLDLKKV